MLKCSDIPKRVNWRRWDIGGEINKLKMHRKMCVTAHFSVHRVFITMLPEKQFKLHMIFKPDFSKTGRRYSRLSLPADSGVSV